MNKLPNQKVLGAMTMKYIYLFVFSMTCLTGSDAIASLFETSAVDYTCMNDCMKKGYMYGYCQKICSY
jgi:hypothetical protein